MIIIRRILKAGFQGFYRNRTVSLSSIFMLTITLCVVMSISTMHYVFSHTLDSIKDKVDIRVYMKPDATDDDIESLQNAVKSISNVRSAMLESRADALSKYKDQHRDDKDTLKALDEIGDNPFGASVTILAVNPNQYEGIVKSIQKYTDDRLISTGRNSIDKINYGELRDSINKLNNIINWTDKVGVWAAGVFILMSLMIVYNTTRLAIYVFREEIGIMKLVGASNFFVRGPFIVEAILYAVVATTITIILFYPFSIWVTGKTAEFLGGLSIAEYYTSNVFNLFLLLLITGVVVTSISSFFAVRKYLKI